MGLSVEHNVLYEVIIRSRVKIGLVRFFCQFLLSQVFFLMGYTSVFSEQLVEKLMESSRRGTIRSFLRRFFSKYPVLFDLMSIQENLLQIC